jgi:hypothetical protein
MENVLSADYADLKDFVLFLTDDFHLETKNESLLNSFILSVKSVDAGF